MTPEEKQALEREYEEMLSTMSTKGWALIMEDFERMRVKAADVRGCTNLDFAKGQVDILDLLAGWREAVNAAHTQLVAPAERSDGDE